MPERRPISAEVTRQLLIESGHRCAVCGAPSPLERAHIVPLHAGGALTADNLICLCANCHTRADIERWPVKQLRAYKEKPWVLRHFPEKPRGAKNRARVELHVELSVEDLADEQSRTFLLQGIAAFLDIDPDYVRIVAIRE